MQAIVWNSLECGQLYLQFQILITGHLKWVLNEPEGDVGNNA